ncbi:DUF4900 domain-containing protein [Deinococcota bacterium DY0809b]
MRRSNGVAVVLALVGVLVVMGVLALLYTRTLNEIKHSGDDQGIVQSLLLARGGANLGGLVLNGPVREEVNTLIKSYASNGAWAFGTGSGEVPDPISVAEAMRPMLSRLQTKVDELVCNQTVTMSDGRSSTKLWVFFTEKACGTADLPGEIRLGEPRFVEGAPRTGSGTGVDQTYAIPFALIAVGTDGKYNRNVAVSGEYRFTIGRGSFARYALFTNIHTSSSGTPVWFTGNTIFDGPVHTNQYFRFYKDPWFGGEVTSAGCRYPAADGSECRYNSFTRQGAEFYNVGFVRWDRMTPSYQAPSYTWAEPILSAGVDWRSSFVPLPENANDQRAMAQNGGLYFGRSLTRFKLWAGDAAGDEPTWNAADQRWEPPAGYQYFEGCWRLNRRTEKCETYRVDKDTRTLQQKTASGSWVDVKKPFNGVVYVEGNVSRLYGPERSNANDPATAPPAVASFAQLTLAASGSMRITGDLKYEDPPCSSAPTRNADRTVTPGVCDNQGAQNVLGLYSQGGDILIGNANWDARYNAPRDVNIHAVLMSSRGEIRVENYDRGSPRGQVYLIGGLIENTYGAFGTFDARRNVSLSGYGRKFVYDKRMAKGLAPPGFPTTDVDEVKSVSFFSYGQREQVDFSH